MTNGNPRILVIRLSAIGDVVRVLPAVHALRAAHPGARLDWAVERKSADLLEGHPVLDAVHVFERPAQGGREALRAFWSFCRRIRAEQYDIAVDFHGILKSGIISWRSGASTRYGFAWPRGQEGSWLAANRRVRLPDAGLNRVEENLRLVAALAHGQDAPDLLLYVPLDIQQEVESYLRETFSSGKLVVAMHAPVERPEKQWPLGHFATLADLLISDGRFEVLLTWGPGQRDIAEAVAARAHQAPVVAPASPSLRHYAWLVHRSHIYAGGDTGPMHIAAAMGTPVVAVFGGTDPAKHAPYRVPCELLDAAAVSAVSRGRRGANIDLGAVTPHMVYDACVRLAGRVTEAG